MAQDMTHGGRPVEKLVEYRTSHYAAHSEAASYFTNTPAHVEFRFANPIICILKTGKKTMRVGNGDPFEFFPGDVMYVPPQMKIEVDLTAADTHNPIECDCVEIDADRMTNMVSRLNENLSRERQGVEARLDWSAFSVLNGEDARSIEFPKLMRQFRKERDVFYDLRIEARIDETLLRLLQTNKRRLLEISSFEQDGGLSAAIRLMQQGLAIHISTETLAKKAGMSVSTFHRTFRKTYGTTPGRFANTLRVSEAKKRLRQTDIPLELLSFELGFSDASHFSRVFRSASGETPAEYRQRRRQPQIERHFHS